MDILLNPFNFVHAPIGDYIANFVSWLADNYRWVFLSIRYPIDLILASLERWLREAPQSIVISVIFLLAWQINSLKIAFLSAGALMVIGLIGAWQPTMTTIAIVSTAVLFCIAVGIPFGVLASKSERVNVVIRPALDFMQTLPSFVYLVPIVMLFGIGNVPGVIVTIFYALPPIVRLTNLGIREVRYDYVEAARAFGANPMQTLRKIEIPLALPTIMTGVNQTIMMALGMTVVASMIAVTGLGQVVLRGIGRLDVGLAAQGGIAIVLLAIVIDRISQGFGRSKRQRARLSAVDSGPIGLLMSMLRRGR